VGFKLILLSSIVGQNMILVILTALSVDSQELIPQGPVLTSEDIVCNNVTFKPSQCTLPDEQLTPMSTPWWIAMGLTVFCVCCAALAAGLTMGLVSLDPMQLHIVLETKKSDCHTVEEQEALKQEKAYARKVLPLIENHHLLLVTLLLLNAAANEALPIFLDELVPSAVAVILSVTFVLFFGEIIPSAIFTGSNQLKIAASLAFIVRFLRIALFPVAGPIAWMLDRCLGAEHGSRYRRAELKALVGLHIAAENHDQQHGLTTDEVTIIQGALEMKNLNVENCMISLDKVFMLNLDTVLDDDCLADILASGYSRIPVYDGHPHNIRGLLLVKNLICINGSDRRTLRQLALRHPLPVSPKTPLLDLLNLFQTGRSHLALVCNDPEKVKKAYQKGNLIPPNVHMAGIITIEDVTESLIQEPIRDETDKHDSVAVQLAKQKKRKDRILKLKHLTMLEKAKCFEESSGLVSTPSQESYGSNGHPDNSNPQSLSQGADTRLNVADGTSINSTTRRRSSQSHGALHAGSIMTLAAQIAQNSTSPVSDEKKSKAADSAGATLKSPLLEKE